MENVVCLEMLGLSVTIFMYDYTIHLHTKHLNYVMGKFIVINYLYKVLQFKFIFQVSRAVYSLYSPFL